MTASTIADLQRALEDTRRVAPRVSRFDALTGREKEVLNALMCGHAAGRIARDQQISVLTVRSHIRSVLAKLNVHSQLQAVSLAAEEHWVHSG